MTQAIEILQRALKDVLRRQKCSEEEQKRMAEYMNNETDLYCNLCIKGKGLEEAIKLLEGKK